MNRTLLALLIAAAPAVLVAQLPEYVPSDGLVSWYPFNGGANDHSANDNHGIINGAVWVSDRYGIEEAALDFNDASHIEIPVFGVIEGNVPVTLSAWVQIDEPSNGVAYVIGYGGGPTGGLGEFFAMGEYGASGFHATMSGGGFDVISGIPLPLSEWVMLTAIHEGNGTVRMYMDTTEVFSATVSVPNIQAHSGYIGASPWWVDSHWDGRIDDVGIWNRALSPEEIGTLNTGSPIQHGCNDPDACNYDSEANVDDGSCVSCETLASACGQGTVWDPVNHQCIVAIPTDTDFDGCVTAGDVLNLLATFGTCPPIPFSGPCQGLDHVTYQGHDYDIVAIGEQCWFAENLQAESYRNGDEIQSGLSDADWSSMSGATSVYGEGTSDCESFAPNGDACIDEWSLVQFGRLYNWHAVDDARELCPSGWHVPTVSDWMDLTEDLDSLGQAGVLMKTSTGWVNNGGGSNDSGFSGQPTGYRSWDGSFQNAGKRGYWWSQTPYSLENNSLAHYIRLVENQDHVNHFHDETDLGFSVRCIKD